MAIEISRIEREFILKNVADTHSAVEIYQGSKHIDGILQGSRDNSLTIEIKNNTTAVALQPGSAELFVLFKGTRISGKTTITTIDQNVLHCSSPARLYRDLSRKFERIRPEESIGVTIQLEGGSLKLDFPVYKGDISTSSPPEINIKFDSGKIAELLRGFREKARTFASDHKIVMFRERQPQLVTEHLVAWSGKSLFLPITEADLMIHHRGENQNEILRSTDLHALIRASGPAMHALETELEEHVNTMIHKKVWHELYIPILYQHYVIGYIYLMRSITQSSAFSVGIYDFVKQFARILAYSLASSNYFEGVFVHEQYDRNDLIDISASGLLFSTPIPGPELDLLSDIDITLHIPSIKRNIAVKARIMRRFNEAGRLFSGVKFLEMAEQDKILLQRYLYGATVVANTGSDFSDESIISESE